MPGLVPEIEERESARFAGYTWREWCELSREDRADCIAWRRITQLVDAHVQEAARDEMESRERAAAAKSAQGL